MPVDNQVVISRIQNRRGTQVEFDALYAPGAEDDFKLQPGEIGLITDTGRVFIGTTDINNPLELLVITISSEISFAPLIAILPPAGTWTEILELNFTPTYFLDIFYSVTQSPGEISAEFTKNGVMTVTSSVAPNATLSDVSTEINTYLVPTPEISFRAVYSLDGVDIQIQYMHNFPGDLILKTGTVQWVPFV